MQEEKEYTDLGWINYQMAEDIGLIIKSIRDRDWQCKVSNEGSAQPLRSWIFISSLLIKVILINRCFGGSSGIEGRREVLAVSRRIDASLVDISRYKRNGESAATIWAECTVHRWNIARMTSRTRPDAVNVSHGPRGSTE